MPEARNYSSECADMEGSRFCHRGGSNFAEKRAGLREQSGIGSKKKN